MLTEEQLKRIFELEDLVIARSGLWNRDVLLCYVPREARPLAMALGYTFRWEAKYDVKLVEPRAGFYWFNAAP